MPTQKIVATPAKSGMFVVLGIEPGGEEAVRSFCADLSGLVRSVNFRNPQAELLMVLGIGAHAWDRLFDAPRPRHLHPFVALDGERHSAPSTPGDLLLHLRGAHQDVCFELMRLIMNRLRTHVRIIDEVQAFKYFDDRDLLGFVDGTENPEQQDAYDAVLVDDDPAYDGGSYVMVQKYVHDLTAWGSIGVEEQERVIGRTKLDDVELSGQTKPVNSHVALNDISDAQGNDLDILRFNMAFGDFSSEEMGTYFIAYAKDPAIPETMLENMFLGNPRGNTDRILDFSTAMTGGLFFVPSPALLDGIDALPPATQTSPTPSRTDRAVWAQDDSHATPSEANDAAAASEPWTHSLSGSPTLAAASFDPGTTDLYSADADDSADSEEAGAAREEASIEDEPEADHHLDGGLEIGSLRRSPRASPRSRPDRPVGHSPRGSSFETPTADHHLTHPRRAGAMP